MPLIQTLSCKMQLGLVAESTEEMPQPDCMILMIHMKYFLRLPCRGGRGKLFIGASCAAPNCSLVNICTANVIPPPEKSEPEISIYHVCPPVKVM